MSGERSFQGPSDLPALDALERVGEALDTTGTAVLVAPPGTGKTTELPPALADAAERDGGLPGRIVVVVPRRMAARAAASRWVSRHGDELGGRFGYSVRHDSRAGGRTVLEAVTPGILLRRLQADPSLEGTSMVVLDEFHERSVDNDLLAALLVDARQGLREDLRLLVMSATLDAAAVAGLLGDAPVVTVESPLHPIETLHRPGSAHDRLEDRVAEVLAEAMADHNGDVLVFLPGRGEIAACARVLERRLPGSGLGGAVVVHELHGSLPADRVEHILAPAVAGRARRIILSTSVAESSLTVPGVRIVVDSGRRRYSEVDRRTGLPALVTRAVSMAGADQRRGRCGREGPGTCYRMWAPAEEETRRASDPPEITVADLSPLLLQVTEWGTTVDSLAWLDPPPDATLERAEKLLEELGALRSSPTGAPRLTDVGHEIAELGFHPRVASIAVHGAGLGERHLAAEVAAVLENEGAGHQLVADAVHDLRSGSATEPLRRSFRQWRRALRVSGADGEDADTRDAGGSTTEDLDRRVGQLVLAGYADRLARRREGRPDTYLLRDGTEIELGGGGRTRVSGLAEWIAAVSLDARRDSVGPGRLHLGAELHPEDVAALVESAGQAGMLEARDLVRWDPATGSVHTDTEVRLGAILVRSSSRRGADVHALAEAVVQVIRREGPAVLPGWDETDGFRSRIGFIAASGRTGHHDPAAWPELSDASIRRDPRWLADALVATSGSNDASGPMKLAADGQALGAVMVSLLDFQQQTALRSEAPKHWTAPSGVRLRLRYGVIDGEPASVLLSCRLQDLLGVDEHPRIGRGRVPVTVELLSPAGRPLQRTRDLPGFWRGSYAQVRAEMRGRYPKHAWPERPWER